MSDEIMDDEVSTPSDEQSGGGASKTFTQADVDKILEQRLARERKRFEKMTDGVDIDEAKRVLAEREQAELERQKERGEFEIRPPGAEDEPEENEGEGDRKADKDREQHHREHDQTDHRF